MPHWRYRSFPISSSNVKRYFASDFFFGKRKFWGFEKLPNWPKSELNYARFEELLTNYLCKADYPAQQNRSKLNWGKLNRFSKNSFPITVRYEIRDNQNIQDLPLYTSSLVWLKYWVSKSKICQIVFASFRGDRALWYFANYLFLTKTYLDSWNKKQSNQLLCFWVEHEQFRTCLTTGYCLTLTKLFDFTGNRSTLFTNFSFSLNFSIFRPPLTSIPKLPFRFFLFNQFLPIEILNLFM